MALAAGDDGLDLVRRILSEAKRRDLRLPVTSTQANLLRAAIALRGGECDSSAIIEAIRPSPVQHEKPK